MSSTKSYEDEILSELNGDISPEAAEDILSIQFSEDQQKRMHYLASCARAGELSEGEQEEADSFERVSSLLGILQSKARLSLRKIAE